MSPGTCKLESMFQFIENWQGKVCKYEQRRKKTLDEDIKKAILIDMCPQTFKEHLDMNASRFVSYNDVRQEIQAYLERKQGEKLACGPAPMEIGAVGKDLVCGHCGKKCHIEASCWTKHGKPDGARGGGGDKGRRKGDKNDCKFCGKKGHNEKSCWMNPKSPRYDPKHAKSMNGKCKK